MKPLKLIIAIGLLFQIGYINVGFGQGKSKVQLVFEIEAETRLFNQLMINQEDSFKQLMEENAGQIMNKLFNKYLAFLEFKNEPLPYRLHIKLRQNDRDNTGLSSEYILECIKYNTEGQATGIHFVDFLGLLECGGIGRLEDLLGSIEDKLGTYLLGCQEDLLAQLPFYTVPLTTEVNFDDNVNEWIIPFKARELSIAPKKSEYKIDLDCVNSNGKAFHPLIGYYTGDYDPPGPWNMRMRMRSHDPLPNNCETPRYTIFITKYIWQEYRSQVVHTPNDILADLQ